LDFKRSPLTIEDFFGFFFVRSVIKGILPFATMIPELTAPIASPSQLFLAILVDSSSSFN